MMRLIDSSDIETNRHDEVKVKTFTSQMYQPPRSDQLESRDDHNVTFNFDQAFQSPSSSTIGLSQFASESRSTFSGDDIIDSCQVYRERRDLPQYKEKPESCRFESLLSCDTTQSDMGHEMSHSSNSQIGPEMMTSKYQISEVLTNSNMPTSGGIDTSRVDTRQEMDIPSNSQIGSELVMSRYQKNEELTNSNKSTSEDNHTSRVDTRQEMDVPSNSQIGSEMMTSRYQKNEELTNGNKSTSGVKHKRSFDNNNNKKKKGIFGRFLPHRSKAAAENNSNKWMTARLFSERSSCVPPTAIRTILKRKSKRLSLDVKTSTRQKLKPLMSKSRHGRSLQTRTVIDRNLSKVDEVEISIMPSTTGINAVHFSPSMKLIGSKGYDWSVHDEPHIKSAESAVTFKQSITAKPIFDSKATTVENESMIACSGSKENDKSNSDIINVKEQNMDHCVRPFDFTILGSPRNFANVAFPGISNKLYQWRVGHDNSESYQSGDSITLSEWGLLDEIKYIRKNGFAFVCDQSLCYTMEGNDEEYSRSVRSESADTKTSFFRYLRKQGTSPDEAVVKTGQHDGEFVKYEHTGDYVDNDKDDIIEDSEPAASPALKKGSHINFDCLNSSCKPTCQCIAQDDFNDILESMTIRGAGRNETRRNAMKQKLKLKLKQKKGNLLEDEGWGTPNINSNTEHEVFHSSQTNVRPELHMSSLSTNDTKKMRTLTSIGESIDKSRDVLSLIQSDTFIANIFHEIQLDNDQARANMNLDADAKRAKVRAHTYDNPDMLAEQIAEEAVKKCFNELK